MRHPIFPGLVLIAALGGCAGWTHKDVEYTPVDAIRPGPGLFTGETGSTEIYTKYEEAAAQDAAPATGAGPQAIPEGLPPDKRKH